MNCNTEKIPRSRKLAEYLNELQMFGIKLGLEQTAELFRRCQAPLENRYIHIAGTNGKGSCGAMIECALRKSGFKTGFYTSPHLVELRERFRINGRAVKQEVLEETAARLIPHAEAMKQAGSCPTFFEFTTALAAVIFAEARVDFVVWETGMGGRCDATSVVKPELALITNIALDHQQYLGNTIPAIAFEKAGIISPGRPVFAGIMPEEALNVIRKRAAELNAPLTGARPCSGDVKTGRDERGVFQEFACCSNRVRLHLPGKMQRDNAAAVIPVLKHLALRYGFDIETALNALADTGWPARCQELKPGFWLDGGHNPDGVAALTAALSEAFPGEKFTVIFAGFKDKDVKKNLEILSAVAAEFIFTPMADDRPSYSAPELHALLRTVSGLPVCECNSAEEALAAAGQRSRPVLAAGSLYLAGEILKLTGPETALDLV